MILKVGKLRTEAAASGTVHAQSLGKSLSALGRTFLLQGGLSETLSHPVDWV